MVVWVLIVLAVLGLTLWRWVVLTRASSVLPPRPDVSGRPAILGQAIDAAYARLTLWRDPADAVTELGRLYHANGFLAEAEACWRLLAERQPREGRWAYYIADARRQANDYPELERWLKETVRRAPRYAPASLSLGAWYFKTGELLLAIGGYQNCARVSPDAPEPWLGLARVWIQLGQRELARDSLEVMVRNSPDFAPGHNLLAEILAADGKTDRARQHRWLGREAGRYKEPDDPWLMELRSRCHDPARLAVLGTMEFQTQRHDRARELLERAAALAPDDQAIGVLLAELYLKTGDGRRARDTLLSRMNSGKTPADAFPVGGYATLSEAQQKLGAAGEALATLEAGIGVHPDAGELFRQRGMVLLAVKRTDEAKQAFAAAVTRNAHDAESCFQLALAAFAAAQRKEGSEWLRRTLAAEPSHALALTLMARLELEAGRLDAAWGYLEPLYDHHWGVPQVRQLVARWHGKAGDIASSQREWDRAETYYRAGMDVFADDAELQAGLGVLLITRERFQEAVAPLEAYRRLQPENARSALYLGQTYFVLGRLPEARRVLTEGEQAALHAGQTATARHCREILEQLP